MKHIIIGTAGHVDHGKSTLIRALTGIDPDRLQEEQERGLTIDIGFAYFDLPNGQRAGIIDVPGHERFVKNMLAGAFGFNLVLLIIAADEGIMPQTREHLNILSLLDVKKGIVALTKIDMVEEEWAELMLEEIREGLSGTFLADAPIVPVSGVTGQGMERLKQEMVKLTEETEAHSQSLPFRLPIDRAFAVRGFGTVITGTLLEGTIRLGDEAEIQPLGKKTRIRSIQNHGVKADEAYAGQRVALNLADVTVQDCQRGQVLAAPGILAPTMMLDVSFTLLKDAPHPLRHWDRVRLHIGTNEVLARAALIGQDSILPGEEALIQLRLEEEVTALRSDRYVIRSYSPPLTIGGGWVLDPHPDKKRRYSPSVLEVMQLSAADDEAELLIAEMQKLPFLLSKEELAQKSSLRDINPVVEELLAAGRLEQFRTNRTYLYLSARLDEFTAAIKQFLEKYHRQYPLRLGVNLAEINSRYLPGIPVRVTAEFFQTIADRNGLRLDGNYLADSNFQPQMETAYNGLSGKIMALLLEQRFSPDSPEEIAPKLGEPLESVMEVFAAWERVGEIEKISPDFYLPTALAEEARQLVRDYLLHNEQLDLGEFRSILETSRKYAMPLLEYFDQQGLTLRQADNTRILRPSN